MASWVGNGISSTLKRGDKWFKLEDSDIIVTLKGIVTIWNKKHRYGFVENIPCQMQNYSKGTYYFGDNYPNLVDISNIKKGMIIGFHLGLDRERKLIYAGVKELNANSYLN